MSTTFFSKLLTAAIFLLPALVLPLAAHPALLLHWKCLVLAATATLLFLTQPLPDPAGARSGADRASMWGILGGSVVAVAAMVLDWSWQANVREVGFVALWGLVVLCAGIGLRLWAIRTLGRFFTAAVRTQAGQALVTTGPYRWVRHPSYLGAWLVVMGLGLLFEASWGLALAGGMMGVAYWYRIRAEEGALEQVFGEAYRAYRRRVKALLPGIW